MNGISRPALCQRQSRNLLTENPWVLEHGSIEEAGFKCITPSLQYSSLSRMTSDSQTI